MSYQFFNAILFGDVPTFWTPPDSKLANAVLSSECVLLIWLMLHVAFNSLLLIFVTFLFDQHMYTRDTHKHTQTHKHTYTRTYTHIHTSAIVTIV